LGTGGGGGGGGGGGVGLQPNGVQSAGRQTPPLQVWPSSHAAQASSRPQPSPITPQYLAIPPWLHVIGTQFGPPTQMPALQISVEEQAPHSRLPPTQPLPILPQYRPFCGVQVTFGVHGPPP
jgi:hypothetical protein